MAYTPLFRLLNILLFFFFPLLRLYRLFYVSTSLPEDLSRHYPCDPRIINAVLARTFRGNLRAPSNYGRFKGETLGTIPGNDILQPFNEMEKRSRNGKENFLSLSFFFCFSLSGKRSLDFSLFARGSPSNISLPTNRFIQILIAEASARGGSDKARYLARSKIPVPYFDALRSP